MNFVSSSLLNAIKVQLLVQWTIIVTTFFNTHIINWFFLWFKTLITFTEFNLNYLFIGFYHWPIVLQLLAGVNIIFVFIIFAKDIDLNYLLRFNLKLFFSNVFIKCKHEMLKIGKNKVLVNQQSKWIHVICYSLFHSWSLSKNRT